MTASQRIAQYLIEEANHDMKTDQSLHHPCIAAIQRKVMDVNKFQWTEWYPSNTHFSSIELVTTLADQERIICSTIISEQQYSILTTRRLITNLNGQYSVADMRLAKNKLYGDFKGYRDKAFTMGALELPDATTFQYYIEVGKASMVMIYGVQTLLQLLYKNK